MTTLPPPIPHASREFAFSDAVDAAKPGSPFELPPTPLAPPHRSRRRASVVAWASLAAIAVAYMGLVAVRPDLVASSSQPPLVRGAQSVAVAPDNRSPEVDELKSAIKSLEKEVATLRSRLASAEPSGDANPLAGIAAQEPQPGTIITGSTGPASADPASAAAVPGADDGPELPAGPNLRLTPAPTAQAPAKGRTPSTDLAAVPAPSTPADGLRIINGQTATAVAQSTLAANDTNDVDNKPKSEEAAKSIASAGNVKIETGSVKPPVAASEIPAFGEAIVKPEPKQQLGLAIGSGPTVDALRLNWSLISESNAEQLGRLNPRYKTSIDGNGLVYNLLAGPIKSKAHGRELCRALTKRAIPCAITENFGGEAL